MKGKRIRLFIHLLRGCGVNDAAFERGLVEGFDLVGDISDSEMFERRRLVAELTREDLLNNASEKTEHFQRMFRAGSHDMDAELYEASLKEVARGWLVGPLSKDEVDALYGTGCWLPARRFGVRQSSAGKVKLRPVDDFSALGHNLAASTSEKLNHGGVDEAI
eukprot:5220373-Amphidinium_carterae.1